MQIITEYHFKSVKRKESKNCKKRKESKNCKKKKEKKAKIVFKKYSLITISLDNGACSRKDNM